MVTRIEIRRFYEKKISDTSLHIIAELPDVSGEYRLNSGEIVEINFEKDTKQGYRFVRLKTESLRNFQRRGRKERKVNVSNEGKGSITLSANEVLFVSTDAKEDQFKSI